MNIICLSNQTWDYPLWTNKRQVMGRIAERGHKVLFVDPPLRLRKVIKQIFQGRWSLRRIVTQTYRPSKNITVYTPITLLAPSENSNLVWLNLLEMKYALRLIPPQAVLWVYNPAMLKYVQGIPHQILVYDCVDEYPAMANYRRLGLSQKVATWEKELASQADIVFATTQTLADKLKKYGSRVVFTSNAGDYKRFSPVGRGEVKIASELEKIPSPRVGFTGAIDNYKVDLELIEKSAQAYPQYSFVLIGPLGVADTQPNLKNLKSLENVHFLGQKPYEELPPYLAGFDAYTIPYQRNDYTLKGCLPVKFHDALSAGLPVVVTDLPAYQPFKEVAYIASDEAEFVKLIKQALEENSPEKRKARMEVGRKNSWEKKVERILNVVEQFQRISKKPN